MSTATATEFKGTITEFAEMTKVEYQDAAGMYRFLREIGVAKDVGKRKTATGRGKPSTIFTCPLKFEIVLGVPVGDEPEEEKVPALTLTLGTTEAAPEETPEPEVVPEESHEMELVITGSEVVQVA